ncbi:hypothetical protein C8R48DRAFT_671970 [Suillus tomentosus]|nr:hypothetical protein C8R48DRAFT_671970 [Suillus tomentosus]
MDVDESSQSRMSLDPLDDIYLGPDDELDSDSGSSGGLDVLNVIPDPSSPALADGLALYDDLDLYLGPEDTLISSDDAPVIPDFPMAVHESTLEPHPAIPGVPGHPYLVETPERQSPEPELNNEALHAMVQEFMPIRSYNQAENRLGDYEQRHGNLPAPTVAQILEADRPFRVAWAETCDKLRKADADLRMMQRLGLGTRGSVVGARQLGLGSRAWYSGLGTRGSVFGARGLVLGVRYLVFGTWALVLGDRRSGFSIRGSVLGPWYSRFGIWQLQFDC